MGDPIVRHFLFALVLVASCSAAIAAQQPAETRVALNEATVAFDIKGAPAIEGRLSTQVLNGSPDSPVPVFDTTRLHAERAVELAA